MGNDRTIPGLLAVSDADARRLLRIALEEGQKVQDRLREAEAALAESSKFVARLPAARHGHVRDSLNSALREAREAIRLMLDSQLSSNANEIGEAIDRARGVLEKGDTGAGG